VVAINEGFAGKGICDGPAAPPVSGTVRHPRGARSTLMSAEREMLERRHPRGRAISAAT
jgi:hypothetical protein